MVNNKKIWTLVIATILFLIAPSITIAEPQTTLTNGLVAYWTMDEVLTDSSGNGHTLTNVNSTPFVQGKVLNATDFTEASENALKITDFDGLNGLSGTDGDWITISLWYRLDGDTELTDLIALNSGATEDTAIYVRPSADYIRLRNGATNNDWNGTYFNDNEWHHLCAKFDLSTKNNTELIADGFIPEYVTPALGVASYDYEQGNLTIMYRESNDDYEDGLIDEVGIWNRKLTDQECYWLYGKRSYPFTETYMTIPKLNSLMDVIPYGALTFYSSLDINNATGALAEVHTEIGSSGEFGTQTNNPTYPAGTWGYEIDVNGVDDIVQWTGQDYYNQQAGTRCLWMTTGTTATEDIFTQSGTDDEWKISSSTTPYHILYVDSTAHYVYSANEPTYEAMVCGTYESYSSTTDINWFHTGFESITSSTTTDLTFTTSADDKICIGDGDGADYNGEADNLMIWDIELTEEEIKRLASLYLANITPINTTGKALVATSYAQCYIDQANPTTDYCDSYILGHKNRITGDDRMYSISGFNVTENLYPEANYYITYAMWTKTADAGENISLRYQNVQMDSAGENWNEYTAKGNESTGTKIGDYEPTNYELVIGKEYDITTHILTDTDGIFTILGHMEGNDDTDYFYMKSMNAVNGYGEGMVIKAENIPINLTVIARVEGQSAVAFIDDFNVTINGTYYGSTSTGQYETNITTDTGTYNITIQNSNYQTESFTHNSILDLWAELEVNPATNITVGITEPFPLNVGQDVTMTCNYTDNTPDLNDTITYFIYNNIENTTTNQTSSTYTLTGNDFLAELTFWCGVNSTYGDITTSSNNETINSTIDLYLKIWIYEDDNATLIGLPNTTITSNEYNYTSTNNPVTKKISNWINLTHETANLTIDVQDLGMKFRDIQVNETINKTNYNVYIAMQPNELVLTFTKNGTNYSTSGYIADIEKTMSFDNSTIVVEQNELETGNIHVRFNAINGTEWLQYYEYYNDETIDIDETLEVIERGDWTAHIQIMDYSNSPLEDATIRATSGYHNNLGTWVNYGLIGQRLTDYEGTTFFFADNRSEVLFTISKEGYTPKTMLITIGDESFTRDNPIKVYLKESTSLTWTYGQLYLPKYINKSLNVAGMVLDPTATEVKITTDYRNASELEEYDISDSKDNIGRFTFTLESGTDYDPTTTDDVIVYLYIDEEYIGSFTMEVAPVKAELLTIPSLEGTILNVILAIVIVLAVLTVTLVFKNENMSIATFWIATALAGMITAQYLWLTAIVTIYVVGKGVHKIISE